MPMNIVLIYQLVCERRMEEIRMMIQIQIMVKAQVFVSLCHFRIESPSTSSPFVFKDSDGDKDIKKYKRLIESDRIDMKSLRSLAWKGIPSQYRAVTWKLLLVCCCFVFL